MNNFVRTAPAAPGRAAQFQTTSSAPTVLFGVLPALRNRTLVRFGSHRGRAALSAAVAALIFGACSTGTSASSSAPEPRPSTSSPPSSSTSTDQPSGMTLLGLGDSVPGAGGACQEMGDSCRSYVLVLADLASKALGKPVIAINMAANNDVTSKSLLSGVKTDTAMRDAISKASIITIQVGNNDWQGPCLWKGAAACLESNRLRVTKNIGRILEDIAKLRGGSTKGVRVVAYADSSYESDTFMADWQVDASTTPAQLHAMFTKALRALNASTCKVARAHHVICVDLQAAFNGPDGTRPAGLGAGHPDTAGHEKIAEAIAKAGFADIT